MNHIFRSIWSNVLNTWVAVSELTSAKGKRSGSCVLNAAALADNESETGNLVKHNRLCLKSNTVYLTVRGEPVTVRPTELLVGHPPELVEGCMWFDKLTTNGIFGIGFKPIAIALACCFSLNAQANPIGAQVVNGTASFNQSGNLLTVTNTPNAIINWQSFSIGSSETTRFIQQSASSSVLNRVLGADPSALLGTLTSNGRVFLINPAGILVGQGANINVPGFVASTLNLSNADFLAGNLNFTANPNAGAIQNNGTITTPEGGTVYLVAPQVTNNGIINTPKGETILAAGNTVQLVDTGTPGVAVQITGSNNTATNLGQILADSGRIGVVGAVVNNSGTISASSLVNQGGRVFLQATSRVDAGGMISAQGATGGGSISVLADMQNGTVNVTGTLDASAPNSGNGGFIETSAAHVQVADTARITTAAANGNNGTWLIDPYDFTIASSGGDITGLILSGLLNSNSVVISTVTTGTDSSTNRYGTTGSNGDIFVSDSVTWSNSANSLTLNAYRDINITAPIMGTGALLATAGRDFNITDTQINTGTQTINVGGNLNLTATSNWTALQSNGTQTINFTGSGITHTMIIQGGNDSGYSGAAASVESSGLQTINYATTGASTLDIQVTGGSSNNLGQNAYVYTNNVQGALICNTCATWNWAAIQSYGGQTITATTIKVNGGSGGNGNYASIENKSSVAQHITTTGDIAITGGSSGGYFNSSYSNDGVGNEAEIHSDGTQTIIAGSITMVGGGDSTTFGGAMLTGKAGQSITTAGNLSMTGGGSSAVGQYGIGAPVVIGEESGTNITLNIGGSLIMIGDSGSTSPALIGSAYGTPAINITAADISMTNGAGIGVLTGGPAGTLAMTATGVGGISQDSLSMMNTVSLVATASYSGASISLLGLNQVGSVTASADQSIAYNTDGTVHLVSMTAPVGITVTSTAASGSDIGLGVLTSTGGDVSITADGAIYDDNGSTNNITANNITLYSINGGASGKLAISADTMVAAGGTIDAEVAPNLIGGATYGGISIRNVATDSTSAGAPSSVTLTDNSINGGPLTFIHVGDIDDTYTSISATTNHGDIAILVAGNLTEYDNILVSTPDSVLIGATGDMYMTCCLSTSGNLALVAGSLLDISGSVDAYGGNLVLVAPTVTIEGSGSTSSSYNTQIAASSLTMSGGSISAQNVDISAGSILADLGSSISAGTNVTAMVTGDIRLNNGSYIRAGNDVSLTFTGPTSTLYLNDTVASSGSPSYILADVPATTTLNFLGRSSGGVVIDGVNTLTTTVGGSGIFTVDQSTPAVEGAGLHVTYFQSQNLATLLNAILPPPVTVTSVAPPPPPIVIVVAPPPSGSSGAGTFDSSGGSIGGTTGTFGGTDSGSATTANGSSGSSGTTGSATSGSDTSSGQSGSGDKGKGDKDKGDKDKGDTANGKDDNKGKQNAKPNKC